MFNQSELYCIVELCTAEKKVLSGYDFSGVEDCVSELDDIIKTCRHEMDEFEGLAGAMDILLRGKE